MSNPFNSTDSPTLRESDFFQPKVSLTVQTFLLMFASASSQLTMALLFVWAARESSLSQFGIVSVGIAIGGALVGLLDFGTNTLWVRNLARNELSLKSARVLFFWKMLFSVLSIFLIEAIIVVTGFPEIAMISGLVAVSFLFNINTLISLRARGRTDLVSLAVFADRIVAALAMFFLVFFGSFLTSQALWISLVIGAIFSSILTWVISHPSSWMFPKIGRFTNPWKGSMSFGIASSSISLQSLDIPISASAIGPSMSGLYSSINRWVQPLNIFMGSFSQSIAPFISNSGNFTKAWERTKKSFWMLYVTFAACLVMYILSDQLVLIILGPRYSDSSTILKILIVGTIPSIFSQILLVGMQSLGLEKKVALVLFPSTILQLLAVWFLSSAYGAVGIALAFCLGQFVTLTGFTVSILLARKKYSQSK